MNPSTAGSLPEAHWFWQHWETSNKPPPKREHPLFIATEDEKAERALCVRCTAGLFSLHVNAEAMEHGLEKQLL